MQIIPLAPVPSQVLTVALGAQACRIAVYAKSTGMYADLFVNDVAIVTGVAVQHANRWVRDAYCGFVGDLAVFDLQGSDDPQWQGLGDRWVLGYLTP